MPSLESKDKEQKSFKIIISDETLVLLVRVLRAYPELSPSSPLLIPACIRRDCHLQTNWRRGARARDRPSTNNNGRVGSRFRMYTNTRFISFLKTRGAGRSGSGRSRIRLRELGVHCRPYKPARACNLDLNSSLHPSGIVVSVCALSSPYSLDSKRFPSSLHHHAFGRSSSHRVGDRALLCLELPADEPDRGLRGARHLGHAGASQGKRPIDLGGPWKVSGPVAIAISRDRKIRG
jgi:hypothetical protein